MIFKWFKKWFRQKPKPKTKIYRFVSETTGEKCEVEVEQISEET